MYHVFMCGPPLPALPPSPPNPKVHIHMCGPPLPQIWPPPIHITPPSHPAPPLCPIPHCAALHTPPLCSLSAPSPPHDGGKALYTEGMDVLLWTPGPVPRLTDIWMMRDPLGWERKQLMVTRPEAS